MLLKTLKMLQFTGHLVLHRLFSYFIPILQREKRLGILIRNYLVDMGPVFIKIGQMLSSRHDLFSPVTLSEISKLLDSVTVTYNLENMIHKKLPNISDLSLIGCGSIAQVYKGTYNRNKVAIKIKKPNIDLEIRKDLELLENWLYFVDLLYPPCQCKKRFSFLKKSLLVQSSFIKEVDNMVTFSRYKIGKIRIPKVYSELCDDEVIVMEWIDGVRITEIPMELDIKYYDLTVDITKFILLPLVKEDIIHGDLHQGNVLFGKDGNLWILDFGLCYSVDPVVSAKFLIYLKYNVKKAKDKIIKHFVECYLDSKFNDKLLEEINTILDHELAKEQPEMILINLKMIAIAIKHKFIISEEFTQLEITKFNAFGLLLKCKLNIKVVQDVLQQVDLA